MNTWTAMKIRAAKGKTRLACVAAYDYAMARLLDEAGIELILVGDSLAMTMLGYETTLPVTMEEMLHHVAAVVRGASKALVVADMPFMSYQVSIEQAIANAGRFIKTAGAGAVKIEGGAFRAPLVKGLVENGMPVLGHIGLTPQSIHETGGYKVQGRQTEDCERLLNDARALEEAGAFAIVLECIPAGLGADITKAAGIPTIGIGAGPDCDGQILVSHDLLGLHEAHVAKFVKQYSQLATEMKTAFTKYREEVESGVFPSEEHCY